MQKQPGNGLRNRACFLIQNSTLGRGQSVRFLQLADMWVKKLENEGATDCWVMGITSKQGKCNQFGRIEQSGAMRHKDVRLCTVGAVALYFFWRFEVEKETPPNTLDNSSWYDTYFMKNDERRQKKKNREKENKISVLNRLLRSSNHSQLNDSATLYDASSNVRVEGEIDNDSDNGSDNDNEIGNENEYITICRGMLNRLLFHNFLYNRFTLTTWFNFLLLSFLISISKIK